MSTEIKPEILALAETIKAGIKIDPKTGLATAEEGLYASTLPEGITADTLQTISKHNQQFVAAGGLALGELSIPLMKKHAELERTSVVIPTTGKDEFELNFIRSKHTGPIGGEKTEKFGALQAAYNIRATNNVGQLSRVKAHLSALATASLAKK